MKLSGIYKITNKINNKYYIGSSKDIIDRWSDHKKELRHQYHANSHLQSSWNKHKEENFIFEILEITTQDLLLIREQEWMDKTKCYDKKIGYNKCKVAGTPPPFSHTTESIAYLREINTGEKNGFYGKTHSKETIEKMKNSSKIRREAADYVNPLIGRTHSELTKKLQSQSKIGKCDGEKNANSKLSKEDVDEIRKKYIPFVYGFAKLAKEYNIAKPQINLIIKNKSWIDVDYEYLHGDEIQETKKAKRNPSSSKLTESQVDEIREIYKKEKPTYKTLADKYNVSRAAIQKIMNGICWKKKIEE